MVSGGLRSVVVVGGGVAGISAIETLRRRGFDGQITLLTAETETPYNRPPLSKEILTGDLDEEDVHLATTDRLADLEIEALLGIAARGLEISSTGGHVITSLGPVAYDALVVASGSRAIRPTGPGWPYLEGVHTLRTLADARAIRNAMTEGSPRVVVIGGGFIGCEVVAAARHHGLDTTLVEPRPWPMSRALLPSLAEPLLALHQGYGVRVRGGVGAAALTGHQRVERVELTDGSSVPADLVVVGVGAVPELGWLAGSQLIPYVATGSRDGLVTDRYLRTGLPHVYAAGDVARWATGPHGRTARVEHWTSAREQGALVAANLLEPADPRPYEAVPYVWSDQFGHRLQIAGSADSGEVHFLDEPGSGFLAAVVDKDRLAGVVALDRPRQFTRARRAVGRVVQPEHLLRLLSDHLHSAA